MDVSISHSVSTCPPGSYDFPCKDRFHLAESCFHLSGDPGFLLILQARNNSPSGVLSFLRSSRISICGARSNRRHFPRPLLHSTHEIKTSQRDVLEAEGNMCPPPSPAPRVREDPAASHCPGRAPGGTWRRLLVWKKPKCDRLGAVGSVRGLRAPRDDGIPKTPTWKLLAGQDHETPIFPPRCFLPPWCRGLQRPPALRSRRPGNEGGLARRAGTTPADPGTYAGSAPPGLSVRADPVPTATPKSGRREAAVLLDPASHEYPADREL